MTRSLHTKIWVFLVATAAALTASVLPASSADAKVPLFCGKDAVCLFVDSNQRGARFEMGLTRGFPRSSMVPFKLREAGISSWSNNSNITYCAYAINDGGRKAPLLTIPPRAQGNFFSGNDEVDFIAPQRGGFCRF